MRDLALVAVIGPLLLWSLKRPEIGAYLWAWLSVMNPHKLAFGFAHNFPFAQAAAGVTLFAFLVAKGRKPFPGSTLTTIYLCFLVWMCVTTVFAIGDPIMVRDRWIFVMKIHLMMLVTLMLLRGRKQIEILLAVVVGSVAFFGIKGGAWTIATGGGGRVWGPPGGMIEGNNELAVALTMLAPFLFYFYQTVKMRWLRLALAVSMVLIAFSVLGSQSRGAFVALTAMSIVLGLKSKHPVRACLLILFVGLLAVGFMPDSWSLRMDTIQDYTADSSAMSRLWTWITLWNLAVDHPIVGAGFGTDTLEVFARYAPTEPPYDIFAGRVYVAHSIYVQVLSEHGFVGLFLYLMLGAAIWIQASRVAKRAQLDPEFRDWAPLLMRMTQVGLAGFAAGGAFLSLVHLDVTFYLMGAVILVDRTMRERIKVPDARLPPPKALQPAGASPRLSARPSVSPGSRSSTLRRSE